MKKILLLTLTAFVFCCQSVLADDNTLNQAHKSPTYADGKGEKPEQSFKDNKAVIAIQKQPATENFQKQSVKNNWFCVVVQVNGKVKDSDNALQPAKQ